MKTRTILALALVLSFVLGGVALAASVTPTLIPGSDNTNKTCAVVMPGTTELKQDGTNGPGPFNPSDGTLSVSIVKPSAGSTNPNSFDWTSNIPVVGVIVKDGVDGANWYNYSPAGSTGDTYLTTPNDGDKGVSHISFCYIEEPEPGSLEVTKVVDWDCVDPDPAQTFEICIVGPSYPTGTEEGACQTADYDGGTLTWDNLTPGVYTVTETDPGTEWTVTIDPLSVTVVSGSTAQASVTNTHEAELGSLEVTKTVNWNKFPVDTSQIFEICITGPSYPGGDCQTIGFSGGTLTWDDLEPGEYTVTETNPGTNWKVEITGSPATVVKDETAQAEVTNTREKPTAITMPSRSFTAEANAGRVTLTWETGTEMDNAGFNLYRAMLQDGPYTQINGALIAAQGDPLSGASYSFVDTPDYGTFYYKLEDVDYNGASTLHGPVKVTVARPFRRPLYRPSLPEF